MKVGRGSDSPLPAILTAPAIRRRLAAHAEPDRAPLLQRFFKTGPGEYGEGDVFAGVRLSGIHAVCRECRGAPLDAIRSLLRSRVHEERLLALLLLVDAFRRGDARSQRTIYEFYLSHTPFINSWDLVDASAPSIVGGWLNERSRSPLRRLARSTSLWERRIAILATFYFIRHGELEPTFRIADILLEDRHHLIQKAVGWMLRETGNRNGAAARQFLTPRYRRMPRTMLRYAIEKFPTAERRKYLSGRIQTTGSAGSSVHRPIRSHGASIKRSSPRKSSALKR